MLELKRHCMEYYNCSKKIMISFFYNENIFTIFTKSTITSFLFIVNMYMTQPSDKSNYVSIILDIANN